MSMTITNDHNIFFATNAGNSNNSSGKADLPSFVGKVFTREELLQSVKDEIKQNQNKKLSLTDMVKKSCFEGSKAKFRFAGESKIYTFGEYIQELEKRSNQC